MKLISWNVNGIRSILQKGFLDFVKREQPDVMCLQETRAHPDQVDLVLPGYASFWNPAQKKGYAGTAVFTKHAPRTVRCGMGVAGHDTEGRVTTVEFPDRYLVTVYTPNAQRGLTRLSYRLGWEQEFLAFVSTLQQSKPVLFCGDLNVAHEEIDLARPDDNRNNPGFTDQERTAFSRLLAAGFVDTFRHFNRAPHQYTWWSNFFNARQRNIGWRIDYFCASAAMKDQLREARIYADVKGSDHCPIGLVLK